jgi:hypothetical protein
MDYQLIRSSSELGKSAALSSDQESCGDGVVNTLSHKGLIVTENGTSLLEPLLQKHEWRFADGALVAIPHIFAPI